MNYISFPNLPSIHWKIDSKDSIYLDIAAEKFAALLENKNLYFLFSSAGLLEASYVACVLEIFAHYFPEKKLFWFGPREFHPLFRRQNLASYSILPPNYEESFLGPLKEDEKSLFFNLLYHYKFYRSIDGQKIRNNNNPALVKIIKHSFLPWNQSLQLNLRSAVPSHIEKELGLAGISKNAPIILILPNKTGLSRADNYSFCSLSQEQILSLAIVAKKNGILTVVLNSSPTNYLPGSEFISLPFSLDLFLSLLPQTKALFSEEIDFFHLTYATKLPIHCFLKQKRNSVNPTRNDKYFGFQSKFHFGYHSAAEILEEIKT